MFSHRQIRLSNLKAALAPHLPYTRFAPSPTGYLHHGHLLHMLFVWGIARILEAEIVIRLEDHDRQRCRSEYEAALLEDLDRLGLGEGQTAPFLKGRSDFRQSDCGERYEAALKQLDSRGHRLFHCDCSRKDILSRTGQKGGELRYDGHCRNRKLEAAPNRGLRVELPDEVLHFDDLWLGPQIQHPLTETGDLLLRDRNGHWTYHFAVVVDDMTHGINLVIRGEDILPSTGRQMLLGRMLGGPHRMHYLHHPLIVDESGRKLSKSENDPDIHSLLQMGKLPSELFGEAAFRGGWLPEYRPISIADFQELIFM